LGRVRPRFAPVSLRSRPHAYVGRSGGLLSEIYVSDHAETRKSGRFRWLLSTCLAATVGAVAILVVVAGSMDNLSTEEGLLAGLEKRLQQAPLPFRLAAPQVEGLRWAIPKADKMLIPTGAIAMRSDIADPIKERRGYREYTLNKYYVRLAARLGPVPKKQAVAVPPFNPLELYADAGPVEGSDRPNGHQERSAPPQLKELNGILPNEDGQELDAQDVLALVVRAQAAEEASDTAGGELLAQRAQRYADKVAPQTTALYKTGFELEEPGDDPGSGEVPFGKGPRAAVLPAGDRALSNSLYASFYHVAAKQGVPPDLIMMIMRIHAYGTDFRQRVRVGDGVELFFDTKGEGVGGALGELLATFITAGGATHKFYRFRTSDGVTDFYDATGRTGREFLMRQPVRGVDVRLTSGFGMRRHPLLHTVRPHNGIDWAAAPGTPIMAAGNGVIEFAGDRGEYGKFVRIRHANGYKTTYAHMLRFAAGVAEGVRVRRGQIIGYVGQSGLSSGPHLHFEVMVKNRNDNEYRYVDPRTIPVPNDRQLTGKDLADFRRERARIDALMQRPPVRSAQLQS
jgi:murein DD-endopeptidase MepM/ murein hydrolase activator NlpD